MSNDPDQIRAQITELLGEAADPSAAMTASDLDSVAARLEEAHELLVHALESVEKG
jgi:hypothetical protein